MTSYLISTKDYITEIRIVQVKSADFMPIVDELDQREEGSV